MLKKLLLFTLLSSLLFSCSSIPEIETSGLVINEGKGEFFLAGERISEKEAEDYFMNKANSDKIVVMVEDDGIGVYTIEEAISIASALIETILSPEKLLSDPLLHNNSQQPIPDTPPAK